MSFSTRFLIVGACVMCIVFIWMRASNVPTPVTPEPIFNEPYKVASKDGCDTYTFLDEDFHKHYYTRCPNTTVTHDQDWNENVRNGKFYTLKHQSETTETGSN
jgi:hypothetical protein